MIKKVMLCGVLLLTCVGCSGAGDSIVSETYEVGEFNVEVPDGWLTVPFYINGTEETMTDAITIYKEADDADTAPFNNPGIGLSYSSSECALYKEFYDDAVDVDDVVIGDVTLEGFSVGGMYPMTQYVMPIGEGCMNITLWQDRNEGTINIDEEEVEFIIESVELTLE